MKVFFLLIAFLVSSLCCQLTATTYILISNDGNDSVEVPYQPNASFSLVCEDLIQAQTYIIKNVYSKDKEDITDDIIIYIKKGTYQQDYVYWEATSSTKKLKILAYNNEEVIFDGKKQDGTLAHIFFELANKKGRTNLWIEGLTIQNYINGIWLGNTVRDKSGKYFKGIQNSHNVIKGNIFKNIGNKFSSIYQPAYSALGINNSTNNLIEFNIFYANENDKPNEKGYRTNGLMHSVYIAHYSTDNLIKNNYITLCSGDAIRIRNASHNNIFDANYIQLSGTHGFITEWYRTPKKYSTSPEERSNGNIIKNNICTFSHPQSDRSEIKLFHRNINDGFQSSYIDINNFVIGKKI